MVYKLYHLCMVRTGGWFIIVTPTLFLVGGLEDDRRSVSGEGEELLVDYGMEHCLRNQAGPFGVIQRGKLGNPLDSLGFQKENHLLIESIPASHV